MLINKKRIDTEYKSDMNRRDDREKMKDVLKDMSFAEIQKYFDERKLKNTHKKSYPNTF